MEDEVYPHDRYENTKIIIIRKRSKYDPNLLPHLIEQHFSPTPKASSMRNKRATTASTLSIHKYSENLHHNSIRHKFDDTEDLRHSPDGGPDVLNFHHMVAYKLLPFPSSFFYKNYLFSCLVCNFVAH